MALRALLYTDKNAPANPWRLPAVSFRVYESTEALAGARLTIYECDYGEGVPADGALPQTKEVLARFSVDATPGGKDGLRLAVTPVEGYADGKLVAMTAKGLTARAREARFAVYFGKGKAGKDLFLPVALGLVDVDDGVALELGMELEVGGQVVATQLTAKETSASALPIRDALAEMLTLATPAPGAAAHDPRVETGAMAEARRKREADAAAATDAAPSNARKAQKTKGTAARRAVPTLGRFNDAWRKPSVEPADAPTKLDPAILDLVKKYDADHGEKAQAERPPPDIDVDGLRFTNFVAAADRRTVITDVLAPRIKHAWAAPRAKKKDDPPPPSREGVAPAPDEPTARKMQKYGGKDNYGGFGTGDIERAYFIVHDIGSGRGPFGTFRFTNESIHQDDARKADSVHGYLNQRGHYATYRDFGKVGMSVVNQFTAGARWLGEACIGIETVPYASADSAADTAPEQHPRGGEPATVKLVSMGWVDGGKGTAGIYKWSDELMDALADLYVLASARAGHLLTVTAHAEIDRALIYSVLYGKPEETRARLAANGQWAQYARTPYNMHGDPYGFDMQVFYDRITAKLNALARGRTNLELPEGVRYGVHPARILGPMDDKGGHAALKTRFPGLRLTSGNGSDEVHTFPHQSNPTILTHHTSHATWNEYTRWSSGKWFWQAGWVEPTAAQLEAMRDAKEAAAKKAAADRKAAAAAKKKAAAEAKKAAAEKK